MNTITDREQTFDTTTIVGGRKPNNEALLKVTGSKKYIGDMKFNGMLHAKVLFSPVAHAKITHIDTSKAEAVPGVRAVATYKNTPEAKFNSAKRFIEHGIPNTERIFDDTVRFVGDKVAAVAADTEEIAKKAISLIEVEYEELPIILTIDDAIKEGAYHIHEGGNIVGKAYVNAGDIDKAFEECDYIFEDSYTTQGIHHAAIEKHIAIADWNKEDKLVVYTPCQNIFGFRVLLGDIFGLAYSKINVVTPAIGGAFGGKLEMVLEPIVAILSKMTRKPVRLEYSRKECIASTRQRHPSQSTIRTGFMKDGTIKAVDILTYTNTGAYASSALNVSGALTHKVFKPYSIANMRITVHPVYTNTPIAGAMRGYGSPQVYFPLERQFNQIANFLNMDAADLQLMNMVNPDSLDPCFFKPLGNPRPKDCLKRAMEMYDYKAALAEQEATKNDRFRIGVGVALGVHGNNCFGAHRDTTTIMIKMNEDGSCILFTGSHDMGNDNVGMQKQIVSHELGITLDKVDAVASSTDNCMWHLGDYASRGTYVAGAATLKAALSLKQMVAEQAAELLEVSADEVVLANNRAYHQGNEEISVSLRDVMIHCQRDNLKELCAVETHVANRGPSSYGFHIAKVQVDTETGDVKVIDYTAVQDVGFLINPMALEGQLAGAIHMGLGYALSENLEYDEKGKILNTNFKNYHLLSATEMPKLRLDFVAEDGGEPGGPYGAKSLGECPVVPVAPAIVNAICNATKGEINSIPATKERVLQSIK